jgi:hypothetical protein
VLLAKAIVSAVLQQLSVAPFPAEVGDEVVVAVVAPAGPVAGLGIEVELPDRSRRSLGPTDRQGIVRVTAELVGEHVYRTQVDGVALVAPHRVVAARPRWLYALACVPLGLALLWRNARGPGRPRGA